jgi:hypothetical protein
MDQVRNLDSRRSLSRTPMRDGNDDLKIFKYPAVLPRGDSLKGENYSPFFVESLPELPA